MGTQDVHLSEFRDKICSVFCCLLLLQFVFTFTMRTTRILTLFATFLHLLHNVEPARILSIAFFSSRSHALTYEPLLHALASRGHDVTLYSPVAVAKEHQHPNLKQVTTVPVEEVMAGMTNFFEMRDRGEYISPFTMCMNRFGELCRRSYGLPQVKALLDSAASGGHFDVVLLPPLFNECLAGLVHRLNTSLVLLSPFPAPSALTGLFGSPSPPAFVPNMYAGLSDRMTLWERAKNVYFQAAYEWRQRTDVKPKMEALYRELLQDQNLPGVDAVLGNASLLLSTSHFAIEGPRPLLPDVVEVGGMHCRPPAPLPKDLEEFVSGGKDGFIYFSMGSALKGSMLPPKYRAMLAEAFAVLPNVRVLWTWDADEPPVPAAEMPKNVRLGKWFPQQDLLGHPKIRAFITHGGLGSVMEAVYHSVPIVGIPIYGDQPMNVRQGVEAGYAVQLEFTQLTSDRLVAAVNKILTHSRYAESARALSAAYRDQPQTPLERAVFWVEFVIRHGGAPRLRSPARDLWWFQYYSLDLALTAVAAVGLLLAVVISAVKRAIGAFGGEKWTDKKIKVKKN